MKGIKGLLLSLLILSIIFLATYFIFYYRVYKITLKVKGDSEVKILYGSNYVDVGAAANKCTLAKCIDISDRIKITNSIDTSVIGVQEVTYSLEYNHKNYTENRKVFVYENIPPVINLKGKSKVCLNKEYVEEGYDASDNYDGDITDNVIVNKNDNTISYSVKDSSGNETSVTRKLIVSDSEKPVLNLKGKNKVSVFLGNKYVESGYSASDNCDGDITNKVKVSGSVNTNKKGIYTLTYEVSDSQGNTTSVKRTVTVYDFNVNNVQEYINSFENYLNEKGYNVGIGYYNFDNGYTYTYNVNKIFYGASLVKTVDALYAYEKLNLDSNIKNLVSKAISVSDNDAHKSLVDMIGRNNLKKYADNTIGTKNFLDVNTSVAEYYGNTTVYDQMAIWKYLYNYINNNSNGEELESYFINGYGNYLLFSTEFPIMHKYGKTNEYYHDVGIVLTDSPYLVVVLTAECCNNVKYIIGDISSKIYNLNEMVK